MFEGVVEVWGGVIARWNGASTQGRCIVHTVTRITCFWRSLQGFVSSLAQAASFQRSIQSLLITASYPSCPNSTMP